LRTERLGAIDLALLAGPLACAAMSFAGFAAPPWPPAEPLPAAHLGEVSRLALFGTDVEARGLFRRFDINREQSQSSPS